jgi:hypothetical protein
MNELDFGHQILDELEHDEVTPEMKMALAQGLLPLDQSILMQVLFHLAIDADASIAMSAQRSLSELPDSSFAHVADSPESSAKMLHALARLKIDSAEVLKRLVLNKTAEDQTIELVGRNCVFDEVLSLIAGNQERLLRHPVLFDVLLESQSLAVFKRQQLGIYKQELIDRGQFKFQPKAEPAAAPEPVAAEPEAKSEAPVGPAFDLDLIADFELGEGGPFSATEMVPFHVYMGQDKLSPEQRERNIYQLVQSMNPKERLRMAQFGPMEVRGILIRDGDRKVAMTVLKNPKLGESEIERFARMRNINDEVLREIGTNRNWLRNYVVLEGIVLNPRTPIGVSLNLLSRLRDQDLRHLVKNREVPLAVRTAASQRIAKKTGGTKKSGGH